MARKVRRVRGEQDSLGFTHGDPHPETPRESDSNHESLPDSETLDLNPTDNDLLDGATAPKPPSGTKLDLANDTVPHVSGEAERDARIEAGEEGVATELGTDPRAIRTKKSRGSRERVNEAQQALIGSQIGDYRIEEILGRGGMGVVFRGEHLKLRREVAVKMILGVGTADDGAIERFETEARTIANLQHPNVVQLYEVGEKDGSPYLVLEYVSGGTLVDQIKESPLDPKRAAMVLEPLARAIHLANEQGILHRDLKPANILISANGTPKVTDFGLAKELVDSNQSDTKTGTVMGTPSFMSPEQAQGRIRDLTSATDQYSLGAVLYACVTGRPPFMSSSAVDTISQVVNKEPVPLRHLSASIPADLETICLKALEKDPAKRYANCQEFAEDLRRYSSGEPILARPISSVERLGRWCKRNPRIAIPSALASVFFIAAAFISSWAWATTSSQALLIAQERDVAKEQRDEATRQKILAQEAQLQAERNEEQAEAQALLALKNIQLILTDVDQKLATKPGMSEIRIGILEVVEQRWNELDVALAGGIEGEAIPTLNSVRGSLASAWNGLGKYEKSDAIYRKVYETAKERMRIKDGTNMSRANMAIVCQRWARVREAVTGDPADSKLLNDEAMDLLRDIMANPAPRVEDEPGGATSFLPAATLVQALTTQANKQRETGQLKAMTLTLSEITDVSASILSEIAEPADWFVELDEGTANAVEKIFTQYRAMADTGRAVALCSYGEADEAKLLFETAVQDARQSVKESPEDWNCKEQLMMHCSNYGKSLLKLGEVDAGAATLAEAMQLAKSLHEQDASKAIQKRNYSSSLYYLGVARTLQGSDDAALGLFERSRVIRTEQLANADTKSNKVNLMLNLARLGDVDKTAEMIDELSAEEAEDPDLRLDLARACSQLAKVSEGDSKVTWVDRACVALQRSLTEGLSDPFPVQREPDLIPLRGEARFDQIVARLTEKREEADSQ